MVSKQVVGWHILATMTEELTTKALQHAFWAQPPTPDLLVHSDRGGAVLTAPVGVHEQAWRGQLRLKSAL